VEDKRDKHMSFNKLHVKEYTLVALSVLCLLLVGATWARAAQGYTITRQVIGSGGAHLEQGSYTLDNTLGQLVVGLYTQGSTSLCAGFWCREIRYDFIYLPLVLRNSS
jgi:hypothetical protein